jgi:hypothetical protein
MNWLAVAVVVLVAAIAAYAVAVRPWMLGLGTTEAERSAPLTGDHVVPSAR